MGIIQEFRYSVSDVVFVDIGDAPIPIEHQMLFDEYCRELDILPVSTPLWRSPGSYEYKNCLLEKSKHKAYTKSLLCSNDEKKVQAGIDAMLYRLDRYYESFHMKKYMQECRANLERMRMVKNSKLRINLFEDGDFSMEDKTGEDEA